MKLFYYSMCHCGGLTSSLKTKVLLSENEFLELFKKYNYEYYCFDERINCIRFIISNISKYHDIPTWLLIQIGS